MEPRLELLLPVVIAAGIFLEKLYDRRSQRRAKHRSQNPRQVRKPEARADSPYDRKAA
jgi:hypothetical protein